MAYRKTNIREALLKRAAEIIAESGIEALTFRGLARDLGVSHAAPSVHFADRSALLVELAKDGLRRSSTAMDEAATQAAGQGALAQFLARCHAFMQFARENPAYFRAIYRHETRAATDEELHGLRQTWFDEQRAHVRRAQQSGFFPDAETDALLAATISFSLGSAALFSDPTWLELFGDSEPDTLAESMFALGTGRPRELARRSQPVPAEEGRETTNP